MLREVLDHALKLSTRIVLTHEARHELHDDRVLVHAEQEIQITYHGRSEDEPFRFE